MKTVEIEITKFDADMYQKNLEENTFEQELDGIGGENIENNTNDVPRKPV